MIPGQLSTVPRRRFAVGLALVCALACVWILGTAPSGGPDEPVHIIRGAALVRGELDGSRFPGAGRVFELPAWIGHPDHGCFSLRGEQPASCATDVPARQGDDLLVTTAIKYPIWGHLAPGLGSFFPPTIGNQLARLFDAAIPVTLIGAAIALAARRGRVAVASVALAVTPMAWFSIVVVNPSGLAISGGVVLWAALLAAPPGSGRIDRLTGWAVAAGWAAMVLSRRDGMIWAASVVTVVAVVGMLDVGRLPQRLGRGPLIFLAASTIATMGWAFTSDTSSSSLLLVAPLLPVAGVLVNAGWRRWSSLPARMAIVTLGAFAAVGAIAVAMTQRPGGSDSELLQKVIGQSGANLEEAIGVLGWLDTSIPRVALFAWLAALGVLAGIVVAERNRRDLAIAVVVLVVAVVAAWVLEMNQGNRSGTYWQGRYYLPFLVGVPLLLGFSEPRDRERTKRVATQATVIVGAAMFVLTMAFAASLRRWGVGTDGSLWPWEWDTYGTLFPPWSLLVAHVVIGVELTRRVRAVEDEPTEDAEPVALATIAASDV